MQMNKTFHLAGISLFALTAFISGEHGMLPPPAHAKTAAGPNIVNVVAKEYGYEMPDTLPSGPTQFHFTDAGSQLHHMTIVKLKDGKTLADFKALPPGPPPSWVVFMGGPNTPMPGGGTDNDVVDLSPGNYAVLCLIPGPDGKPHMMKGMIKALTVKPSSRQVTMPATDLTLTLSNYAFKFSTPPTAGRHAIRVINHGNQPHEAVMFRLKPGKRGEDIADWVLTGMKGPPPGAPVAGISPMAPGKENTLLLDLDTGNYALLCFAPDAKNGKPHAALGMIYNFKI
jgi:uncharacterized cupredoxin-like copper-binding protein